MFAVAWACILSECCVLLVPQSTLLRICFLGCRVRLPFTVLHILCLAAVGERILCALLADGSALTPRTTGGWAAIRHVPFRLVGGRSVGRRHLAPVCVMFRHVRWLQIATRSLRVMVFNICALELASVVSRCLPLSPAACFWPHSDSVTSGVLVALLESSVCVTAPTSVRGNWPLLSPVVSC